MNGHKNGKAGSGLLLFGLFGLALCLFGNLYEGMAIAPNSWLIQEERIL